MQWPNRPEYAEAVRDYPHVSLQDPKLKGGTSKRGKDNLVISDTGAFSIVFPIDVVSKIFALRCWVKEVGNAKKRYEEISAYLSKVRLPYFVDFEYVPEGIFVKGKRYPITRMEWVEGVSLRDFIAQNLQNPTIFKTVADKFQKMVADLHANRIAHGDLQDGNILIEQSGTDIQLKLIDYDSVFVPTLQGHPDQIVGLPEYQHPQRIATGGQADEKVDYFSELVIYLSFLSLAEKPELWNRFKDKTERGLLFSKEDFENPATSAIFQEITNLSSDVQDLAAKLKDFCAKTSIDQLEPLEAILPKPDADTHSNLGLAYLHKERYADAINIFEQLITDNPTAKEAHHQLAIAYFKSGDNSKATAAAHAALGIDPSYQPAHQLLDAIKNSTISPPVPPKPPGPVPPPDPRPDSDWIGPNYSLINWYAVISGALGLALVICFIWFLTKINAQESTIQELNASVYAKDEAITQMESTIQELNASVYAKDEAIAQMESTIQELNASDQESITSTRSLENERQELLRKNRSLENERQELLRKNRSLENERQELLRKNRSLESENQELLRRNRALANEKQERRRSVHSPPIDMVLIPAGEFQMGSNDSDAYDDEKPVHPVYLDAFYMDKYEVTNAQYKAFVDANPLWQKDRILSTYHNGNYLKHWNGNNYPVGKGNHPVVYVSWYAAMAYSKWAGKRLPTEAEWEKAARGGLKGQKYPWGNSIDRGKANYARSSGGTTPVGQYAPNAYGLYDMAGNVWEWCLDGYQANFYARSPRRNPVSDGNFSDIIHNFTAVKGHRVLRGGSRHSHAKRVRCANRNYSALASANISFGFRCVRDVNP